MRTLRLFSALLVSLCGSGFACCGFVQAEEPAAAEIEFFEARIRPLLISQCFTCHANGETKGGLSLESPAGMLKGGDSGEAIVPGKPEESLLIEAISHQGDIKMPPKQKLSDKEIADLTEWVKRGAPWPKTAAPAPVQAEFKITPEQRQFWSFQPVGDPAVPTVQDAAWPRTAIDFFILSALEQQGLKPVPPADRPALIRRATFDLIGLPPTPQEVDDFVADSSADAFAKVVDRLLASPHYGERWGRYWLDVARYGEDQAHTFDARQYPQGFRYRDWVVQALNRDLPYDQFLQQQIAGDLLEGPDQHDREIALGYFALGPVYYKDAGCAAKAAADELDDRVDTLARGLLGLTVACARCHDHKFDPISQQDYYALAGVFFSTNYREAPLVPDDVVQQFQQAQQKVKEQEEAVGKFLDKQRGLLAEAQARRSGAYLTAVWKLRHPQPDTPAPSRDELAKQENLRESILERWEKYLVAENKGKLPQLDGWYQLSEAAAESATLEKAVEVAAAFEQEVAKTLEARDARDRKHAEAVAAAPEAETSKIAKPDLEKPQADLLEALVRKDGLCTVPRDKVEERLDDAAKQELAALKKSVEELKKAAPPQFPIAHSLTDGSVANMKIYIRGNPANTGPEVPRRFLSIFAGEQPALFSQGSGRLELARAIASPDNPLTARVMVNRVWQHHFGRGIVGTPSNFGTLGERPTHPELLDYLARRFVALGWSLKALHREMMLSATYQAGAGDDPHNRQIDPENRLLWKMNRRRLDVEGWRDALLAVSGNLDPAVGGPPGSLANADFRRRTLYGAVSRHNLDPLLRLFDFPDPNISSEERSNTTVPLQQLFVLNGDFLIGQAKALAARLGSDPNEDPAARIRRAFLLIYGRPASEEEVALGLKFLSAEPALDADGKPVATQLTPWEQYAQILLSTNEFTYID